jgi:zinc D-Ala-D-Ala carboxypeptidase
MDWSKYPNFTEAEFRCKHTGKCHMQPEFMARLQMLRNMYGKPMRITSGFRDRTHPAERDKQHAGTHTMGIAADVAVTGGDAYHLVKLALDAGFTGIGVNQKGNARFIHLDTGTAFQGLPRPTIWSY